MDLVDLILLACSLADPTACHEHHLLFESAGSLQSCVMQAPPTLAHWADEHPALRVVSWRCEWPDKEAKPI
jgi:hypothetical protein